MFWDDSKRMLVLIHMRVSRKVKMAMRTGQRDDGVAIVSDREGIPNVKGYGRRGGVRLDEGLGQPYLALEGVTLYLQGRILSLSPV